MLENPSSFRNTPTSVFGSMNQKFKVIQIALFTDSGTRNELQQVGLTMSTFLNGLGFCRVTGWLERICSLWTWCHVFHPVASINCTGATYRQACKWSHSKPYFLIITLKIQQRQQQQNHSGQVWYSDMNGMKWNREDSGWLQLVPQFLSITCFADGSNKCFVKISFFNFFQ